MGRPETSSVPLRAIVLTSNVAFIDAITFLGLLDINTLLDPCTQQPLDQRALIEQAECIEAASSYP
jgi:hypothetical protein